MISDKAKSTTLLSSQPIYTAQKELFGFELLLRQERIPAESMLDSGVVSRVGTLDLCHKVAEHVGIFSRKIFINLSESLLLSEVFLPVPADSVVIELPATVQVSEALVNGIKEWRNAGFCFALDYCNFNFYDKSILQNIQYIKVDASSDSIENLSFDMVPISGCSLSWIVEHVETEEQFIKFRDMGFSLFQGYFLAIPVAINRSEMAKSIHNSIAMINILSHPRLEVDQMTRIICCDPILPTQILNIVNSPLSSLVRPIQSIRDAIIYLGLIQVRKWVIMMTLFNDTLTRSGTIHLVLTRAKACENYAEATLFVRSDQAFLTGLLSGTDLLFGVEAAQFLRQIPIPPLVESAIHLGKGPLGRILRKVKQIEHEVLLNKTGTPQKKDAIYAAYHEASDWTCSGSIKSNSHKNGIVCTPSGGVQWVKSFQRNIDSLAIH